MITTRTLERTYRDSVFLMRLGQQLSEIPGVTRCQAIMATPANQEVLSRMGMSSPEIDRAGPSDLVIAVDGPTDIEAAVDAVIAESTGAASMRDADDVSSVDAALAISPKPAVGLLSVPGEYATSEARRMLSAGLHVFLFSSGVSLADECELKQLAAENGRILMGPDCGTTILDGLPFGFANQVRRGPIGLVGAAGTGLQEVSSLIDRCGGGVSQVIGTGGRDLTAEVGAATTLRAIRLLANDPNTSVIGVVAKATDEAVASAVVNALAETRMPTGICLLGWSPRDVPVGVTPFPQLDSLATALVRMSGETVDVEDSTAIPLMSTRIGAVRGLFSGGTLAHEAALILAPQLPSLCTRADGSMVEQLTVFDAHRDVVLDLGAEEFVTGRPHPMIDPTLRCRLISQAANHPETSVVLFDVVLGYGSHPDPAGVIASTILGLGQTGVAFVASVTGTDGDAQPRNVAVRTLRDAGVLVMPTNAAAAEAAAAIATGRQPCTATTMPHLKNPPHGTASRVLPADATVVNVGLRSFHEQLRAGGARSVHVRWMPPAMGDPTLAAKLADFL